MSGKQRLSSPHFLRRLNEQVRPNRKRFPDDFLFELTIEEFANLKSRFATSSWGGRRKRPLQSGNAMPRKIWVKTFAGC
jgi:hypothetical protein